MAKSKYEYVREFESATDHQLLLDSYIVVRVDGQCFHRFAKEHNFLKPNDKRCLDLMNRSAISVMKSFYPNIIIAYGQSDEYSFVLRRMTQLFNRRQNKISTLITSAFTAGFIYYWNHYFHETNNNQLILKKKTDEFNTLTQQLKYPPTFDGRCVLYPNEKTLRDYLSWRQVDCHVNNLYNTTFYALTGEYTHYSNEDDQCVITYPYCSSKIANKPAKLSTNDATQRLSHTSSGDKNEILFSEYGINYNNELEQFRKGTVITINEHVVEEQLKNFRKKHRKDAKSLNAMNQMIEQIDCDDQTLFDQQHIDIISDEFWKKYNYLIES